MGDYLHVEEEEEASRLSFSNLPLMENNSFQHTSPRSSDQFFEFFKSQTVLPIYSNQDVVFCGKIIHEEEEEEEELNEFRKRDYFANRRSHSFRRSTIAAPARKENPDDISCRRHSGSTRFSSTPPSSYRVNITALTSMSAKSRRRMFMFGPVKFKPEMELSEIKQRLRREPAAPGKVRGVGGSGRRLWSVVRSNLRLRWQLTRVLTKSFGCLPVGGGGERGIVVGN